jgi:predicted alpha-1,2-mannosidase
MRIFSTLFCLFFATFLAAQHTQWVNPFIGTGGHGHTFPGATLPHGMVQLSPDTRLKGWDGCSGYHDSDSLVYGFSHTHLSGTGVEDYCDILLMPTTGKLRLNNGADNTAGYRSAFAKKNEVAQTGYYRTYLDDYDANVELTSSLRAGFHRYTFKQQKVNVVLDLKHRDKVLESNLKVVNHRELEGTRISNSWAKKQHLYFVIRFSEPFKDEKRISDENGIVSGFKFKLSKNKQLLVKIGISAVSIEGARKNLDAEIQDWDFDRVQKEAAETWEKSLSMIDLEGGTNDQKTVFYTALYHTLVVPNIYQDVDGQYRGMDGKTHLAEAGHTQYSVFSLWDTFRAANPLYTILEPERVKDYINTFLHHYEQGGRLPVWELAGNETFCMIGTHSIPVIADAYAKGIQGFDVKKALLAMQNVQQNKDFAYPNYYKNGFIAAEEEAESVSKTLEYAFDDAAFCYLYDYIDNTSPEILKDLGIKKPSRAAHFYENIFDPETKLMRAKRNQQWISPFDPAEVNSHFTEGNSWQYSFFAPQDVENLVKMHGGRAAFEQKLDALFQASTKTSGREQSDITGLIGQYAHGNEPSHHVAYLYALLGKNWKTERLVRQICNDFYTNKADGLIGNEDCGQMSAWYVFSALGFYPLNPVGGAYIVGTPAFPKATLHLANKHDFVIKTEDFSTSTFVKKILINGREQTFPNISHYHLLNAKNMTFVFGKTDTTALGFYDTNLDSPTRKTSDFVSVPYIFGAKDIFFDSTTLQLAHLDSQAKIFYQRDNGVFQAYNKPLSIKENTDISLYASLKNDANQPVYSDTIKAHFHKIPKNRSVTYVSKYASQYDGGGALALIDLQRGNKNYQLGAWQGFEEKDMEIVVDLHDIQAINYLSLGALQDQNAWIFMPTEVHFSVSTDGTQYSEVATVKNTIDEHHDGTILKDFKTAKLTNIQARYIKVKAINRRLCPAWHKGFEYNGKTWIFADELSVE